MDALTVLGTRLAQRTAVALEGMLPELGGLKQWHTFPASPTYYLTVARGRAGSSGWGVL